MSERAGLKFGDSQLVHRADETHPHGVWTELVLSVSKRRLLQRPLPLRFPSYNTRTFYTHTHSRFTHSKWLHKPPHTVAQHTSNKTTSSTTSKTLSRAFALEFRQHFVVVFGPSATETSANHGPHTTTMSSSIELPQAYAPTTSPEQGLYSHRTPHEICSNSVCARFDASAYA